MNLNETIMKAVGAVRGACHCDTCGAELLRTPRGSVCGDWQCSGSPVASTLPPPAAVRDGQLREAGYVPASPIRPAMPSLRRPSPREAPSPAPLKSAAQRAQEVEDDIRWAQGHQEMLARGREGQR